MSFKCSHFITFLKIYLFICSIVSGGLLAIVWRSYELTLVKFDKLHTPLSSTLSTGVKHGNTLEARLDDRLHQPEADYANWLRAKGLVSVPYSPEELSYGRARFTKDTEARFLRNQTRVLCMVLSRSKTRTRAIRDTWTRHCNKVVFYGKFSDKKVTIVPVEYIDAGLYSVRTFCQAFHHLSNKHTNYDWLMITTDRTYAIIENLRHLVAPLDASKPYYIGRPVHHHYMGIYNAYDSGIVLSRAAVQLLADANVFGDHRQEEDCRKLSTNIVLEGEGKSLVQVSCGNFDAFLGLHLARLGCNASNSYDLSRGAGGSRFHPFMPERHLSPDLISVFEDYWSSNVLPIKKGFQCCSDTAITFTGFSSVTMYFVEYILYHLSVFPDTFAYQGLGNRQPPPEFFWVASDLEGAHHKHGDAHHHHHHHSHPKHADVEYKIEPGDIVIEGSGGGEASWFPANQHPMPPPPTLSNKVHPAARHSME